MESAALTQPDLHRIETFYSQSLGKMHKIPATFYTEVLAPEHPTTTNQQLREQSFRSHLSHTTSTGHNSGCLVMF